MSLEAVSNARAAPQIAFLLHANRSGSTFLASSLADTRHVGVTIESTFFARLVEVEPSIRGDDDVGAIMHLLRADRTYSDWDFDENRLRQTLFALPRPAGVEAIARALLRLWFDGTDHPYVVVKGSRLYLHVPKVRRLFPAAKFLHIVRDPRAVYNSQARSIAPGPNMPMAHDPLTFARSWRAFVDRLDRWRGPDLLEIRYEDLIADRAGLMATVCDFLAAPGLPEPVFEPGGGAVAYFEAIPDQQKALHDNVKAGAPMAKRIDAWRHEIAEPDLFIIQETAKAAMRRLDYAPLALPLTTGRFLRLVVRLCRLRATAAVRACRRYWFYLHHPTYLREAAIRTLYRLRRA